MNAIEHDAMQKLQESIWQLEARAEVLECLLGQLHTHEETATKLETLYNHWQELAKRDEKSPMVPKRNQLMANAAKNLYHSLAISRQKAL